MITPKELGKRYSACEKTDGSDFRRKARILQSMWREQRRFPIGEHLRKRPLGSRLPMPDAQVHLWNYISDNIKAVVRREVLNPVKSREKKYFRPRIFDDLLASQPLCFNLFGELQCDLTLATNVMRSLSNDRIHTVTGIEFEHSPGRGDARYTADGTAFDVFISYSTPAGRSGFVGIEVKYHENLRDKPARHKSRYDEIAKLMGCFKADSMNCLKQKPLQEMWRDHLLAGILRHVDGFDDGYFLLLHPNDNPHCTAAIDAYRNCLASSDSFASLTLESLVSEIRKHTDAEWVQRVYDRYLDFDKIERLLIAG